MANLMGMFFGDEEKTRMLAEIVGEVDSYGGRLVPIVELLFQGGERNLLVLEREADESLCRYFEEILGLSLPDMMVLPHSDYLEIGRELGSGRTARHPAVERIAVHLSRWMDGYVTDEFLVAFASATGKRTLSTPEGSRRGNDKLLLHRYLEEAGLPLIPTELAEEPDEVEGCLRRLRDRGFGAAVVKTPVGASGIGLVKVESIDDFRPDEGTIPEHFFGEGPCLVQGWLKPGEREILDIRSPSVQLYLDEDEITLYDITEQILSQWSVHEGNESPPPYLNRRPALRDELLRQAGSAGTWLHRQGYQGTASVDFLVAEGERLPGDGGGTLTGPGGREATVYVCEINARVTGATYPSVLAHHLLPGGTWLMRNLRFRRPMTGEEVLDRLDRAGDLFRPDLLAPGILPINFNFGTDGLVHKGQFLCLAPTLQGSELLLRIAEMDLPCDYDRD